MKVARLSLQAIQERVEVSCIIASVSLRQQSDERSSFFAASGDRLDTSQLYNARQPLSQVSEANPMTLCGKNNAPPRFKFFGWLKVYNTVRKKFRS
jgi:hypothetical protein